MTVPVWTSGTLYLPGSLVRPVSGGAVSPVPITNPGFESGDSGWTKETGWTIISTGEKFAGTWSAQFDHASTTNRVLSTAVAVSPGQSITAACYVSDKGGAAGSNAAGGAVILRWLDSASAQIRVDEGNSITDSANGWKKSTVTAVAPSNAAFVQVGARGFRTSGTDKIWVDSFTWNAVSQVTPDARIFEAVQTAPGTSANTEPTWPTVLGNTVVDGTVTWKAVSSTRVTWKASHLMVTGTVEPTWPTTPGLFVADGSVSWECLGRNIADVNCPNSKVVAIAAGKVFAGDKDIVRFCATANPLDWSTSNDAGYLPTGLQQANSNDTAVLNLYRSNLVVFNASTFQMWQIDPDPAAMALLDQMEGIGSEHQQGAQAIGNELFFLSQLGVRTVGIAAGSTNLASGDVGAGVDVLVQAALGSTQAANLWPVATYYPSAGQFWLAFPGQP